MDYNNEWINDKCDRYDYLISVFSGVVSGFVDVFFCWNSWRKYFWEFY